MKPRRVSPRDDSRSGMVLFVIVGLLAALTVLGGTVFMFTSTDIRITGNYKTAAEAFEQAEAGLQYAKNQVEAGLASGQISLSGNTVAVNIPAPAGYTFDTVTSLTRIGSSENFMIRVTGRSMTSSATIEAVLRRKPLLEFGLFGDREVDLKASSNIYSYDSSILDNPAPADSTGEASVGSNIDVTTYMNTFIDGDIALGADAAGTPGQWYSTGVPIITGEAPMYVDRVPPDPLGARGGDLAQAFVDIVTVNDNARAVPPIGVSKQINLGNGQTMTLPTGSYYLRGITLKNGATLNINASAGPVTIYLVGGVDSEDGWVEMKNGSVINILGKPTDFSMLSNAGEDITVKHDGTFKGLIYAPYAFVEIKNSGNVYGLAWAQYAHMKNSGDFYVDTALLKKYLSSTLYFVSWKEVRN